MTAHVTSPHQQARDWIHAGLIDLVTCDVFDTLVWRAVSTPSDQFVHLAEHLHRCELLPGHVTATDFMGGRILAEQLARKHALREHDHHEVTLEEIWEQMPLAWRLGDGWAAYLQAELTVEAERLRLHAETVDLLGHAHAHGVPIALVSDIYLSSAQLTGMLRSAGAPLDAVDRVITSSDHRLGKAQGLLARVIAEYDCPPGRVVHLGDNPISDVATARALGASVVVTDVAPADRMAPALLEALAACSRISGSDSGLSAAVRTTLVRSPFARDAAYQFGAAFGGPVVTGCAAWVSDTAAELGVDRIHYLLREGAFIAEVASVIRPEGPEAHLVHASRWVVMRAAVIEGTAYEMARAILRRATLTAQHVVDCFGVDLAAVERVIGVGEISDDQRWGAFEKLAADVALRDQILAASAQMRRRLMRYLDTAVSPTMVDGRERIVVCDIGWGGTIQEGLAAVLAHEGRQIEIIGLYLLLSEPGVGRVNAGAHMIGYLPATGSHARHATVVSRNPELLEELCTPPLGTLVDIDERGIPVLAEVPDHAPDSRERARQAVVDFARTAAELGLLPPGDPLLVDPAVRGAVLEGVARTLQAPDARLAAELATWSHDDVAGTAPEALVTESMLRTLPHLDVATAQGITMREIFWLPGAAALHNPTLAAQFFAVQQGASAAQLCPPSQLGEAVIAVYPPGSDQAAVLVERVPTVAAHGWMLIRAGGSIPGVRNLRIDFGDRAGLVQLGFIEVRLQLDGSGADHSRQQLITIERADDPRLHWGDAQPVGTSVIAAGAEGHLVFDLNPELGSRCVHIAVTCAFRAWPDAHLGPASAVTSRLRRALGRLARRLARRMPPRIQMLRPG